VIDGVVIKPLRVIPDERGRVMEILRRDDELFEQFGQCYCTTASPGVVKAWHAHRVQSDNIAVVSGMAKIVLYDGRESSPTHGEVVEIFAGTHNPVLVHVPPMVYHGFKCISREEAVLVNCPTEPFNRDDPDEVRLPAHDGEVPYDWARKDR
jgi:dTDP-4-dehydrorhamnose 3,5-epimerase